MDILAKALTRLTAEPDKAEKFKMLKQVLTVVYERLGHFKNFFDAFKVDHKPIEEAVDTFTKQVEDAFPAIKKSGNFDKWRDRVITEAHVTTADLELAEFRKRYRNLTESLENALQEFRKKNNWIKPDKVLESLKRKPEEITEMWEAK